MAPRPCPVARNYHARWEQLISIASGVFAVQLKLAASQPRHYILDQTNVYPRARERKMHSFRKFGVRKAMVVVPPHQVWRERVAGRELLEGKNVPDEAVAEMKADLL